MAEQYRREKVLVTDVGIGDLGILKVVGDWVDVRKALVDGGRGSTDDGYNSGVVLHVVARKSHGSPYQYTTIWLARDVCRQAILTTERWVWVSLEAWGRIDETEEPEPTKTTSQPGYGTLEVDL